ncbi:MAG: hypothetical protein IT456_12985 [Planctomycetes bacterium]|nr:hypothetical protein [Planctomycetota bacterium]
MRPAHSDVTLPDVREASEFVLPKPPRGNGEVFVVGGRAGVHSMHRRSAEAAKCIGDRILMLAECQQQFLAELRHGLEALDGAVAEDSRARLKGSIQASLGVLEWCEVSQRDLLQQAGFAAQGWQPIDLGEFCREFANEHREDEIALVVAGQSVRPWWGDAARLHDVLHAAVHVITERTGGCGSILLEVVGTASGPRIRLAGTGEPREDLDAGAVKTFRQAVSRLGATVEPDALGIGGAGLVIGLPQVDG